MKINPKLLLSIYPIGAIYLSTNSTDPGELFGGVWKKVEDDAYLKIVTSNAGETGGTSKEHKIPIESMPSHRHALTYAGQGSGGSIYVPYAATIAQITGSDYSAVSSTGGGQAYYPWYIGIYMWIRIS